MFHTIFFQLAVRVTLLINSVGRFYFEIPTHATLDRKFPRLGLRAGTCMCDLVASVLHFLVNLRFGVCP